MIFSIQRFIEDYFQKRNLSDVDQFSVSLSNLYDSKRAQMSQGQFLLAMRRVRTLFYKTNAHLKRRDFERGLLKLLDDRFVPSTQSTKKEPKFSTNLSQARQRLSLRGRLTIKGILLEYKSAVESRGIDAFWKSRKKGILRSKPESIAQSLLATALRMFFRDRGYGLEFREFASGVGFVDVGVVLSRVLHLIELKVLVKTFQGPAQLQQYMISEGRREGWLILLDTRPEKFKTTLPATIRVKRGEIKILCIDINPVAPSKKKPL
jgi:hypothetical protein